MSKAHVHASHVAIVKRLKRTGCHLAGLVAMIEAGRSCCDIARQRAAVESAVKANRRAFAELHAITRYL